MRIKIPQDIYVDMSATHKSNFISVETPHDTFGLHQLAYCLYFFTYSIRKHYITCRNVTSH